MKWLVVVIYLCGKPIDLTLYDAEENVYLEHTDKKTIKETIKDEKPNLIIISPTRELYCS